MSHLILYDGFCTICSKTVKFIINRDPDKKFLFLPLHSEKAHAILEEIGAPSEVKNMDSIILIESDFQIYTQSTAALRIIRRLEGPIKLLSLMIVLPSFIRDSVYQYIARNRFTLIKKQTVCNLPSKDERSRFLDF